MVRPEGRQCTSSALLQQALTLQEASSWHQLQFIKRSIFPINLNTPSWGSYIVLLVSKFSGTVCKSVKARLHLPTTYSPSESCMRTPRVHETKESPRISRPRILCRRCADPYVVSLRNSTLDNLLYVVWCL